MECTVHRGMTGVTLGKELFTDLDFADDVSLLAEMLEVLVLALTVMQEEVSAFGLQINWSKTKLLQYKYVGEEDLSVKHQAGNKLRLYQTYIVLVLMYGYETWATTKYLLSRLDAFDTWALHKILRIPYSRHVSNAEVRRTTGCSPLSRLVTNRRLRLFSHIARSSPREDHYRALSACIRQVPHDWKRPAGRSSHTWLCAIEADFGPLNFGLATAWRKATTRDEWRHIADTAML